MQVRKLRAPLWSILIAMSSAPRVEAQPEPPAPEAPPESPPSESVVTPPELVEYVAADLPEEVSLTEPTSVELELTIAEDGAVADARALGDAPAPLTAAAEQAVRRFRFKPATVNGQATAVVIRYRFWFAPTSPKPVEPPPAVEPATPNAPPSSADNLPHEVHSSESIPDESPRPEPETEEVFEAVAEVEAPPRQPTKRTLPQEQLGKIAGSRGDPVRAIEVLPGVSRAPAGVNPLIRGSGGHESIALVEGTPIPQLYHFGGLTSVIHFNLLKEVNLYPGNFSSRYGRATGGVVEAKLRGPRTDALHGVVDLNLVDSSVSVEAPLGEQLGFLGAVRRSNIDLVFENFVPEGSFEVVAAPVYWDYQGLWEYQPDVDSRLRLFAFGSRDTLRFVFSDPVDEDPRFRGGLSGKIEFHTVQLSYAETKKTVTQSVQVSVGSESLEQRVGPDVEAFFDVLHIDARGEWDIGLSQEVHWISGVDFSGEIATGAYRGSVAPAQEGTLTAPDSTQEVLVIDETRFSQISPAVYTEARWYPHPRLLLVPGLRLDLYEDLDALTVNPRFSQRYSVTDTTTLKSGLGWYSQRPEYYESLDTVGNPDIDPYHSLHVSLGVEQVLLPGLELSLEGFYKYLYDRVVTTPAGEPPRFLNDGTGRIYGAELGALYQPDSNVYGQLSYTLSRSERQDRDDARRLFDYDQTHVLNAVLGYQLGKGWELGLRGRYISGNPLTPVLGAVYDARADAYVPRYGRQNSQRDPAFHQLDVRIAKRFAIGRGSITPYLEVLNAYNAENREGYEYSYDYSRREGVSGTPLFPNLGVRGEL